MKQIKFQKYPFQRHILRDSFEVAQSAISCAACALFSIIPSIGSAGKPPRLVRRRTRTRHIQAYTCQVGVGPNCTNIDYRSIIRFASYPQGAARDAAGESTSR